MKSLTVKDILQLGYGIDFSTLDFKTVDKDCLTKEEILKSMETNEVLVCDDDFGPLSSITEVEVEDDESRTILFLQ